jgi:hypothetical protein
MQQHDVRKCKSAIRFMLEGMLIDAATEDTGANATVVPDKVVAKMEQRGLAVERIKLKKALVFKTARADGPEITCRTKIIVKRLTCQVSGVSVVFRKASLFVSNDIEEMLIGRDILDKTGLVSQIAISPKPSFSLCFRRHGFVNNRMALGFFTAQLPAWGFPRPMKLYLVDHRLLVCRPRVKRHACPV